MPLPPPSPPHFHSLFGIPEKHTAGYYCGSTHLSSNLYLKLTPSLAHAQIYLARKRTIIQAPLPLQVLKSRNIVDVKRNIYLRIFLYSLKLKFFFFHHKHKDDCFRKVKLVYPSKALENKGAVKYIYILLLVVSQPDMRSKNINCLLSCRLSKKMQRENTMIKFYFKNFAPRGFPSALSPFYASPKINKKRKVGSIVALK